MPVTSLPADIRASLAALKPTRRSFHGAKISLAWFPGPALASPCADKFDSLSPPAVRALTKLPFNATTQALLSKLGGLMGDTNREQTCSTSCANRTFRRSPIGSSTSMLFSTPEFRCR